MSSEKALLILRASNDVSSNETIAIENIASMHGVTAVRHDWKAGTSLTRPEGWFSIVWLAGHADEKNLAFAQKCCDSWKVVAEMLCNATCLLPNTTVFLACCYGGNLSVAQSVFSACPNVSTIVGSEGRATKEALMLAFHAVLYNFVVKETSICEAAKRASEAAQLDIACHDIFTLQSSGNTSMYRQVLNA